MGKKDEGGRMIGPALWDGACTVTTAGLDPGVRSVAHHEIEPRTLQAWWAWRNEGWCRMGARGWANEEDRARAWVMGESEDGPGRPFSVVEYWPYWPDET
jgi:hypothetical protein